MDISADKNNSSMNRADPFSAARHAIRDIIGWLTGVSSLTESDRMKAGIHIRRQGT